jgi:hypothetical protein
VYREKLAEKIAETYKGAELLVRVSASQADGKVQSFLRAHGQILNEEYLDGFVLIDAKLGQNQLPDLQRLHPEKLEIIQSYTHPEREFGVMPG